MINRFSKMRDSWFTKIILTITALSFMSLFGVTGYINTANSNKAVIKVDNLEISQSEFSYMLQRDLARLNAAYGNAFEDGDGKAQLIDALLKTKLNEMILENTLRKNNIDFTQSLIQQIILITPQFQNGGKFDYDAYKWYINNSGKSERDIINEIRQRIATKILLEAPVAYVNVPEIQLEQMAKVIGQRRTFKYIKVENSKANVNREPSAEELDQYYEDLGEELMIPETRDLTVLYIPESALLSTITIPQEEIDAYYKEHIDEFEQDEQRSVMQMVFADRTLADAAYQRLQNGEDFAAVAADNGQTTEDINLGYVAANDVSEELSEVVFALSSGAYSAPTDIAGEWQLLKVSDIKPASKTDRAIADEQIIAELRQDKAYDSSYEIAASIEDKLGAGASLDELAETYKAQSLKVKGLNEEGQAVSAAEPLKNIIANKEFLDTAFSYNEGETGQTVETDDGIVVVMVDKVIESHQQPRDEAQEKLKALWIENERAAITQELIDNIEHDLDAGDDLSTVANRYGLQTINSRPATRDETIDRVSFIEMKKLFTAAKNEPQIIKVGDDYIVAETTNIYDDSVAVKDEKREELKQTIYEENAREMADALLKDYARDYKIEVNYNRAGLNE